MGYKIQSLCRQIFAGEKQAFAIGEKKIVTRLIKVAAVKIEGVIVANAIKSSAPWMWYLVKSLANGQYSAKRRLNSAACRSMHSPVVAALIQARRATRPDVDIINSFSFSAIAGQKTLPFCIIVQQRYSCLTALHRFFPGILYFDHQ